MDKLAIFLHIYQKNEWIDILQDQVHYIINSGLYDAVDYIHLGINGEYDIQHNLPKISSIKKNINLHLEADTLCDLKDFCVANPTYKVLYLHLKGCSHTSNSPYYDNIRSWRKYMEYFVIENWKKCVELLDTHDTVGTEWWDTAYISQRWISAPHYSGNFWWANANYVSKLDKNFLFEESEWQRWLGEFWIGSASPNYYNFLTLSTEERNNYVDKIEPFEYMEQI